MKKNYRDFTVGELLDMGVDVHIHNHNIKQKDEATKFVQQFEGTKNSSHSLSSGSEVVQGWKEKFKVICFL